VLIFFSEKTKNDFFYIGDISQTNNFLIAFLAASNVSSKFARYPDIQGSILTLVAIRVLNCPLTDVFFPTVICEKCVQNGSYLETRELRGST